MQNYSKLYVEQKEHMFKIINRKHFGFNSIIINNYIRFIDSSYNKE